MQKKILLSRHPSSRIFLFFMKKMDSIENTALVGALLKVRNTEDLGNLNLEKKTKSYCRSQRNFPFTDKNADYPGGINALRQEVANLFYSEAVFSDTNPVKTNVAFVVEKKR